MDNFKSAIALMLMPVAGVVPKWLIRWLSKGID